jgi:WD40 repeat protein
MGSLAAAVARGGEALPPGALARLGSARLRHTATATGAAFSADGKTLATVGDDDTLRTWDLATGKALRAVSFGKIADAETDAKVGTAVLSPDARLLAVPTQSAERQAIHVLDVASGKELRRIDASGGEVDAVAFSADGRTLAWRASAGEDRTLAVWDTADWKEIRRGAAAKEDGLAISADGKTLAAPSGAGALRLSRVADGAELRTLAGSPGPCLAFSPDAKLLAWASRDEPGLVLWDLESGREVRELAGAVGVGGVAFAPDGKRVAAITEKGSALFDVASGAIACALEGSVGPADAAFAFSPDGRLLALTGADNVVRLFDTATGKEALPREGHSGPVVSLAFSPDAKTLASGGTGDDNESSALRLWDVASGRELRRIVADAIEGPRFSADGKVVSGTVKTQARSWEVASGKQVRESNVSDADVAWLAPDGAVLACLLPGAPHTLRIRETASGKELRAIEVGEEEVRGAAFAPDGKLLATQGEDGTPTRIFEVASGKELLKFTTGGKLAFSADGKVLALEVEDEAMQLWAIGAGRRLQTIEAGGEEVAALAFSPDGRFLAEGCESGAIRLIDAASGRELRKLAGHGGTVNALAFSPDGRLLASASDDTTIILWDVASGK